MRGWWGHGRRGFQLSPSPNRPCHPLRPRPCPPCVCRTPTCLGPRGLTPRPHSQAAPVTTPAPCPSAHSHPLPRVLRCPGPHPPLGWAPACPLPPVSGRQLHRCPLLSEKVDADAQRREEPWVGMEVFFFCSPPLPPALSLPFLPPASSPLFLSVLCQLPKCDFWGLFACDGFLVPCPHKCRDWQWSGPQWASVPGGGSQGTEFCPLTIQGCTQAANLTSSDTSWSPKGSLVDSWPKGFPRMEPWYRQKL